MKLTAWTFSLFHSSCLKKKKCGKGGGLGWVGMFCCDNISTIKSSLSLYSCIEVGMGVRVIPKSVCPSVRTVSV